MSENENDIILEKVLKSIKLLAPEDLEPVKKEDKVKETPMDKILRKEWEAAGHTYHPIETSKTVSKENPIDVMFNKTRKGDY